MPEKGTSNVARRLTPKAMKKLKLQRAIDKEKQGIAKALRERAKILAKRRHQLREFDDKVEEGARKHQRNLEGIKKDVDEQWDFDAAEKLRWKKGLKKKKKKDIPPRFKLIIPPVH